jgi:hypothetical protein
MPGLKWILHGNEYWYAKAESRRVRKEHGRKTRKPRIQEIDRFARSKGDCAPYLPPQRSNLAKLEFELCEF